MLKSLFTSFMFFLTYFVFGQNCEEKFIQLYQKQKYAEAIEYSTSCLEVEKIDTLKIDKGNCYMYLGQFNKANEIYAEVLAKDSLNTDVINSFAASFHRQKKYVEALNWYHKVVELEPNHHYGKLNRAMVYYEMEVLDSAKIDVLDFIQLFPKDDGAFALLGDIYWMDTLNEKAIEAYTTALEFNPENEIALYGRSNVYLELENFSDALLDIERAIKLNKKDADNFLTKAEIYFMMDDNHFKEAEKYFKKSIDLKPDSYNFYRLSICYDYQEKYELAKEMVEKSIDLETAIHKLGDLAFYCLQLGYFDEGLTYINGVIEMDSTDAYYPYLKACLLSDKGDFNEAIINFGKAIQLDDSNASYYYDRGWTYSEMGNKDKALEDYETSILLKPKPTVYYNRGVIHMKNKDYAKAIKDFESTIELDDQFIDAYFNLALCYYHQDRTFKYCQSMRKAANLGDKEAKKYVKYHCK